MLALFGVLALGLAADAAHAPIRAPVSRVTRGLLTVRRSGADRQQPGECPQGHTSIYARSRARVR